MIRRYQEPCGGAVERDHPVAAHPLMIFEPPFVPFGDGRLAPLVNAPELWLAAPGSGYVFVSEDDDNYEFVGRLAGTIPCGRLVDPWPCVPAFEWLPESAPRGVALAGQTELLEGSVEALLRLQTLSLIGLPGAQELVAYSRVRLTAGGAWGRRYALSGMVLRSLGMFPPRAHPSGTPFARLDENVLRWTVPGRLVGHVVYLKIVPGDDEGGDSLSTAEPITYQITGSYLRGWSAYHHAAGEGEP